MQCVTKEDFDEASEASEQTRQDLTKTQKELQEMRLTLDMLLSRSVNGNPGFLFKCIYLIQYIQLKRLW